MIKGLSTGGRLPLFVLVSAFAVHLLMLVYDFSHSTAFFNADRALARWETLRGFLAAIGNRQGTTFLVGHGVVGDYALQAMLFGLGGKLVLILAQVGLALLSGWGVYRIGRLMGSSVLLSSLAAGIYLFLPHTLVFPHQLISEALHSPILVISLWMTAEYLADGGTGGRDRYLVMGALLVGIAALIRPITLLWPLIPGFIVMRGVRVRTGAVYLFLAYLPVLIWAGFMSIQTGNLGLGESSHDMGHNLYQRVWRISETMPSEQATKVRAKYLDQGEGGSLGTMAYSHFAIEYPLSFAQHTARDIVIFVGKSDLERIFIDYLEFNKEARHQLQDSRTGWRKILERDGTLATIRYLWQTQGIVLIISLFGSALMLTMSTLAVVKGWLLILSSEKSDKRTRYIAWLLISLPIYVLLFSQAVDTVQSRHRAPAEAAIVLLATMGGACFMRSLSTRYYGNRIS